MVPTGLQSPLPSDRHPHGANYRSPIAGGVGARQQAMPTWRPTRTGNRGGVSFDWNYRVTIYSMLANQTPLSAIGANIVAEGKDGLAPS